MQSVEAKLESLCDYREQISSEQPKSRKEKEKVQKDLEANQQAIIRLQKFQQFKVNDWVTDQKQIGQITELNLSSGGMPQIWVSWDGLSIPELPERLTQLEENWHQGFVIAQEVEFNDEIVTIVKFQWSEENNCVVLGVENKVNEQHLVFFSEVRSQESDDSLLPIAYSLFPLKIIIDEEFKSLIPVLTPEEKSQLEQNLLSEGCRDPLVIWKGHNILLDGHNRYEICVKNGLEYELIEIELPDREDAHLWMMRNQLGRRNLQPEALAYFRGKLQVAVKQKVKNPTGKNQYGEVKDQNDPKPNTAEKLADEFKISSGTIKRDAQYAKAVDQIAEVVGTEVRPQILSRTTAKKLSKNKTLELAKTAKRKPEEVIEFFKPGTIPKPLPKHRTFPYSVGEVVRIIPKDHPDLRGKGGYWAIITQVYDFSCDLELWNGRVELIASEYLISLELSPSECKQMKVLCDRLSRIRKVATEEMIFVNLRFLASLKTPELTSIQQELLEFIEKNCEIN